MSRHRQRSDRRGRLARLLRAAVPRLPFTRQAGQARTRPRTADQSAVEIEARAGRPAGMSATVVPSGGPVAEPKLTSTSGAAGVEPVRRFPFIGQAGRARSRSRTALRPAAEIEAGAVRPAGMSATEVPSVDPVAEPRPTSVSEAAPLESATRPPPVVVARSGQPGAATPTATDRRTDARAVRTGGRERRGSGRPSRGGCDERSADRGAASVWVVGGIAVLMAVMLGVLWFGTAVVARHQAEGAADLGALAAAATVADGERAACAEARWVVVQMGGVLVSCRLSGWDALVEVAVSFAPFGSAAGRARAGPVELNG